jgi:hypothetical protein
MHMGTFVRPVVRLVVTGAAALAFVIAPMVLFGQSDVQQTAQPCYNGVLPWGPYVPSCTLPGPVGPRVRGAAPDATAIIACRNHPGCLSWYVNGP